VRGGRKEKVSKYLLFSGVLREGVGGAELMRVPANWKVGSQGSQQVPSNRLVEGHKKNELLVCTEVQVSQQRLGCK
jgi:hypothetical protein